MTYKSFGLVLAGGSGSRLWPLSRELFPKQLLNLCNHSKESLFQQTIKRFHLVLKPEDIYIITNNKLETDLNQQYKEIYNNTIEPNFIIEPTNKNTAPAILLSILHLLKNNNANASETILISVPSDHLIAENTAFSTIINKAIKAARNDLIITLGIKPTKPDINYGYIKTLPSNNEYLKVAHFFEKPDKKTATNFINEENSYWNSGILIFKASTMLEEFQKHTPELYKQAKKINYTHNLFNFDGYKHLPDISIDKAIMEKSNKIALIPCNFDWNDLGHWDSVLDNSQKDTNNNSISGNVIAINCENSLIYGSDNLIAAAGLKNTIVVSTEDATLICDTNNSNEVKEIYHQLQKRNDNAYKSHRTLLRPWGFQTLLKEEQNYKIKTICIKPSQRSSIQMHKYKTKHWTIIEGEAILNINNKCLTLKTGESVDIFPKEKHSIQNNGKTDLLFIEIQTGQIINDDDIVRFE